MTDQSEDLRLNHQLLADTRSALSSDQLAKLICQAMTFFETDHEIARRCLSEASALVDLQRLEFQMLRRPGAVGRGGLGSWRAKHTHDFIKKHLGSSLSVGEIADSVGLSKSYFSRAFKVSVGENPSRYIARMRIELAKRKIRAGEPLCEVAIDCGFGDQPHLNRTFRRIVGISPGTWRRIYGGRQIQLRTQCDDAM